MSHNRYQWWIEASSTMCLSDDCVSGVLAASFVHFHVARIIEFHRHRLLATLLETG